MSVILGQFVYMVGRDQVPKLPTRTQFYLCILSTDAGGHWFQPISLQFPTEKIWTKRSRPCASENFSGSQMKFGKKNGSINVGPSVVTSRETNKLNKASTVLVVLPNLEYIPQPIQRWRLQWQLPSKRCQHRKKPMTVQLNSPWWVVRNESSRKEGSRAGRPIRITMIGI